VLSPPQRLQEVYIRPALLPMGGPDLASELFFQVWVDSFHLEVFQFHLGGKVDAPKQMNNLSGYWAWFPLVVLASWPNRWRS
jgi:hypothetical protein